MTVMATEPGNDRIFCWEQISRTNRLFRVSHVFAPRGYADKLLPLYALFAAVEQTCSSIADEDVARSKLNWWRLEFSQEKPGSSRHPVMKELDRTGAMDVLNRHTVERLLVGAEPRLSAQAPGDLESLKTMCIELHRPQLELEFEVCGVTVAAPEVEPGLLARNGLLQLIRESVHRKEQGAYWWIPLNLLARHGVSREEVKREPKSIAVSRLLAEIFTMAGTWNKQPFLSSGNKTVDYSPARHIFSINGLYARKLNRLQTLAPDLYAGELARLGPVDLFTAWTSARRLQQR